MQSGILIITSTFPQGGKDIVSARFVYDLAKELAQEREVHVLCPAGRDANTFEAEGKLKIHRFKYFFPHKYGKLASGQGILSDAKKNSLVLLQVPFLFIAEFFNIIWLIKKEKIAAVNTHWIVPNGFIFALLHNFTRLPHMMTVHAADIFMLKKYQWIGRHLCRYTLARTDMLMPVSRYINDCIKDVSGTDNFKHEIMPMGVDLKKFHPLNTDSKAGDFTFLFVGKLTEKKGLKFLLEAASLLKKKSINFKLRIVGGGREIIFYQDLAEKLNLDGSTEFCGWVSNQALPEIYNQSDCLITPSVFDQNGETEGMPVVILEAMACGKPVLASKISGIVDIVKEGYNGLLSEPANSADLAEKMLQIYQSGAGIYRQNCLDTAERYSIQKVADCYKRNMLSIIKEGT